MLYNVDSSLKGGENMKKYFGIALLILVGLCATIPGWSVLSFARQIAENQTITTRIMEILAIILIVMILAIIWKLVNSDEKKEVKRKSKKNPPKQQ